MDMPCNCPECGVIVEHDDMVNHPDDWKKLVCEQCHDRIEDENNQGQVTDVLGNVISWVHTPDDGLIVFSVNGCEMTTWSCEDDPEMTANDFVKNWNKTQAITLRSIKTSKSDVAEFVLQNECDGSYSQEDVDMVTNELKHVDVWLSNIATSIEQN